MKDLEYFCNQKNERCTALVKREIPVLILLDSRLLSTKLEINHGNDRKEGFIIQGVRKKKERCDD
jgi:hypothetical protein